MKFNYSELTHQRQQHKKTENSDAEKVSLEALKILKDVMRRDINFEQCKKAYEEQFVKHGTFGVPGEWPYVPSCCQSKEIANLPHKYGSVSAALLRSKLSQQYPHCSLLDGGMYDDPRIVVNAAAFQFNEIALKKERENFVKQEEEKTILASNEMADILIEEAKKIDEKECFDGYQDYYIKYGEIPRRVSQSMTKRITMPTKLSYGIIQEKLSNVDPFLEFEMFDNKCWAYMKPNKFQ